PRRPNSNPFVSRAPRPSAQTLDRSGRDLYTAVTRGQRPGHECPRARAPGHESPTRLRAGAPPLAALEPRLPLLLERPYALGPVLRRLADGLGERLVGGHAFERV